MAVVTIVGKPNVGKSTLFNRLIGRRLAITDDVPGVTRDRLYGEVSWEGKSFYLVDTGGLFLGDDNPFDEAVRRQVMLSIKEADVVLLVVDGKRGVDHVDKEVGELLRRHGKEVVVVVNKIDSPKDSASVYCGYELGFERVVGVSAEHGLGVAELMEVVLPLLPQEARDRAEAESEISVAILGRPNVGKSSLFNALLGDERSIVSEVPGTTRDVVDSILEVEGRRYRFLDTAGVRRRSRIRDDVEYYSVVRALRALDRADVALLIMDATEPATDQDKKLAEEVKSRGKALVLILNKWDLVPKDELVGGRFVKFIEREMGFVSWAPLLFVSARTKRNVLRIPSYVLEAYDNWSRRVPTARLNALVKEILAFERMPSDGRGRHLNVYYCVQAGTRPPRFVFFVNQSDLVDSSFERMVERRLREALELRGTPLRVEWRNRR